MLIDPSWFRVSQKAETDSVVDAEQCVVRVPPELGKAMKGLDSVGTH